MKERFCKFFKDKRVLILLIVFIFIIIITVSVAVCKAKTNDAGKESEKVEDTDAFVSNNDAVSKEKEQESKTEQDTQDNTEETTENTAETTKKVEETTKKNTNSVSTTSTTKSQNQQTTSTTNKSTTSTSYHTAWGTRPYEFQEIDHFSVDVGKWTMHWDRYGNTWYDTVQGKSSAKGKYIYVSEFAFDLDFVYYFGNGRWSGNGLYWTENGESGGNVAVGVVRAPGSWGKGTLTRLPNNMPGDSEIWHDLGEIRSELDMYARGLINYDDLSEAAKNVDSYKLPPSPYIGR